MAREDGVKARNMIGGEKKIDRSSQVRVQQKIETQGKTEEGEVIKMLWAQVHAQSKDCDDNRRAKHKGGIFITEQRHTGIDQTHKDRITLPYREISALEDETEPKITIRGHPLLTVQRENRTYVTTNEEIK